MDSAKTKQVKQLYQNIGALLEMGLFAGQYSAQLTEARIFVSNIVADLTKDEANDQTAPEQQPQADAGDGA